MQLAAILMLMLMLLMIAASPLASLSPSALLAAAWASVYGLQSLFASDMTSNALATATIVVVTLSFAVGELIACGGIRRPLVTCEPAPTDRQTENSSSAIRLRRIILVVSLLGAAGMLGYAKAMGIFSARSFADLLILPGLARLSMLTGEFALPLTSRVGVLFAYPGVVLALGYYCQYKWRWWLLLPMINVLIFGAIQAGRAGTMIILLQVLIAVYLKNTVILRKKGVKVLVTCIGLPVALMLTVFIGGEFLREGFHAVTTSDVLRVVNSFRGYLFGGVSAFSYWIAHVDGWREPTWGKYSFSSLFSALGIAAQEPGVYNSYVPIAPNGDRTNLYTAYRSFIEDFSILGAFAFYFLSGAFTALMTRALLRGKSSLVFALIPVLSWLAFSPMYSLTYFNSFLLSCVMPYLLVRKFVEVKDETRQVHLR